ncbi:MAG: beta-N-acetylhexosaminidase [Acetobacter sp.]|nr:beta-N-acetylhexosaminidase [Bacteroides sp.]MCM1341707.1 beta-N-acetylhexosaminidase [Acetobacter sp.]MCM1432354.1 beta-N-acetylhexosaminidase [Clostridiales bacterium]
MQIIPVPYDLKQGVGYFQLSDKVKIKSEIDLKLVETVDKNADIVIKKADMPDEEYKLNVNKQGVEIFAGGEIGAYYALQSVRQLSENELGKNNVPCCEIYDKPRFEWRGLQLDEARHFFGKEVVKDILDMMFMMKLNVFHWHLTDDQGWRIEIKKYPLLTAYGSRRGYTHIGGWRCQKIECVSHYGYYTQEDIAEIVSYANDRGIMVVPEIDFPAHSAAAIASYPWLACREIEYHVPGYFGSVIPEKLFKEKHWNRTLCIGKDRVRQFVLDVIDEVSELFPAPYFHIGGDEAPRDEWKKCPCCQNVMKNNGIASEDDLQGWFNNIVLEHLKSKGKRMIGWNEILSAENLDKSAIAQYWTPKRDRKAEKYINSGGKMIMSNHQSFYFDMTYAQYSLKDTYKYSPASFGVNEENIKNVLGVEGELWTEWIESRDKLELNYYPRIQALAEVAWSDDKNKDWNNFLLRLDRFKKFFEYFNINYAVDAVSMPKGLMKKLKIQKQFFYGDPYMETNLNKIYKAKGEK